LPVPPLFVIQANYDAFSCAKCRYLFYGQSHKHSGDLPGGPGGREPSCSSPAGVFRLKLDTSFQTAKEEVEEESSLSTAAPAVPIKLDTTGVTSHFLQSEFYVKQDLFRKSLVARLWEHGRPDLSQPLSMCQVVTQRMYCETCRKVKDLRSHCDKWYCPSCQPRLSWKRYQKLKVWLQHVNQPKHVVLTARNTMRISKTYFRWLVKCLAKLRRVRFSSAWRGGIWSMEVTNEGRGWHVHYHLLVDADWIDAPQLAREWGRLVGQDFAIVHVSDARNESYLREVAKYAVKGNDLAAWPAVDTASLIDALQGTRCFGAFGSCSKLRAEVAAAVAELREQRSSGCQCPFCGSTDISFCDWYDTTGDTRVDFGLDVKAPA
jgi:ribosomal protein L37AE/L43A